MADGHGMTVDQVLTQVSTFPEHGKPPVKVGDRRYPRSTSDDVPEIVRAAVGEIRLKANKFKFDLGSSSPAMLAAVLDKLLLLVWPSRQSSDTMHKYAARYVVDWSNENGFDGIEMPEAINKFSV